MPHFAHPAIPLALSAVLVDAMGYGVAAPVLPELVMRLGHLDLPAATQASGWLVGIFAAGQFVAAPVMGQLGDRFGRRLVLTLSMVAFAFDYGVMALAPNLLWLFVGRGLAGMFGAVIGPAGAVIADVTPPQERSAAFGWLSGAWGAGFILGPAAGGLIAGLGPRAPFIAAAGLAALSALALFLFMRETLAAENRRPFRWREAHLLGAFAPLLGAGRGAGALILAWAVWQLGGAVYPATWAFWTTQQFHWSPRDIGLSLAYVGFTSVLVQALVTGRAVKALGDRGAALLGVASGAASVLAYAFATRSWQVYAFFLPGALSNLAYPALNGLMSRRTEASRQGALQGGLSSLGGLTAILGPLIVTQAFAWGVRRGLPGAAFLLAGGLMLLALGVIALGVRAEGEAGPT